MMKRAPRDATIATTLTGPTRSFVAESNPEGRAIFKMELFDSATIREGHLLIAVLTDGHADSFLISTHRVSQWGTTRKEPESG